MRLADLALSRRLVTRAGVLLLPLATAVVFLAQDRPVSKAGNWHSAVYAAIERMHDAQDPLDGVATSVWSSSPFYPNAQRDTVLPPESDAASVSWEEHPEWRDLARREIKSSGQAVSYDRCTLTAQSARTVNLLVQPQGDLVVWLNGKEILRGRPPAQNLVPLPLRAGTNELMVKNVCSGPHPMNPDPRYVTSLVRPFDVQQRRNAAMDQLWAQLRADYSDAMPLREMRREQRDGIWEQGWPKGDVSMLAARYAVSVAGPASREIRALAAKARTQADLQAVRAIYNRERNLDEVREILHEVHAESVKLAVDDLIATFGKRYAKGAEYRSRLAVLEKPFLEARAAQSDDATLTRLSEQVRAYAALSREALLANPMLDFDKILVVRRNYGWGARSIIGPALGLPVGNSWTNDDIPHKGWDNQIAVLSNLRGDAKLATFYQPDGSKIVSDVDLDFDASRVMFSSIGSSDRWRLFEAKADGSGLRQITPDLPDVDHFDSCYLPNGRIAFASTASYQAMPCIGGGAPMAQLYTSNNAGKDIRQITFEQDSDWTPSVHNDGRLLYLRWEYTDVPHYFTRLLFHANPDGTNQMEYFHSNSYFPNAYFYPRSIPGHPSEVVGIVSGHHGIPRSGRMILFDPERGRKEVDGAVQEIPGYGRKVEAIVRDPLIEGVWPQFLHPYPLADYADFQNPAAGGKYFLVAMKRDPGSLWGIYLVDIFDNFTLLKEVEGAALLEPIPFRATPRPPVLPDRTVAGAKEARVYLSDIYSGPGLTGIPRGKVKALRLFTYHFNYNNTGGHDSVGIQSGWDIKRILGTVPVEADGSASFKIPANIPVSLQPLDEKGHALQLMRSWFTGAPGEVVSCVGCHERQNTTPLRAANTASRRPASDIKPWYGPARPIAFRTEVQPVLDRYCVSCHNSKTTPSFTSDPSAVYFTDDHAYIALQAYVHRYGPESDYHLLKPMEFHASTSRLFQVLDRGHHGVQLDAESYDRLATWVDLNVPWRGSWGKDGTPGGVPRFRGMDQVARRLEFAKQYAGVDIDPEHEFAQVLADAAKRGPVTPVAASHEDAVAAPKPTVAGWPFDAEHAHQMQTSAGVTERSVELGNGARLDFVLIPAGSYVMGDGGSAVRVEQPFYMGRFEVSNRQYAAFDPQHDSRYTNGAGKDHYTPGYPANLPEQPVIRITWEQAQAFCQWLSQKTGEKFSLPTEEQWEWAARAGSAAPFWFGDTPDFSRYANLADRSLQALRTGYNHAGKHFSFAHIPYVEEVDDHQMISAPVGQYLSNPWGLFDMHGNVAEWTLSGRGGLKIVRGGSWRDLPRNATSASRLFYEAYQPVMDVGFRVIMDAR